VGAFSHKFSIAYNAETTDQIKKKVRGCKNGTNLLYHRATYGGDRGSRAGCRRKIVMFFCSFLFCFLPAGLREAQTCQYCFYSVVQNGFFAPQGRHVAPIHVKFGTGPRAKFRVYRGKNVGTQSPKLSKFRILAINLPLGAHSFSQFLQNSQFCTRL